MPPKAPVHYALRLNYKVCPLIGKGNGVVATRPIKRGERIMVEKPLMARNRNFYDRPKFTYDTDCDSEDESQKAERKETEEHIMANFPSLTLRTDEDEKKENEEIMAMVKKMPKERQRAFLELYCSTPGHLPFLGTFQANALPLITSETYEGTNVGVFLELSRLNHDCAPNAEYSWNAEKSEGRVFAVSDINPGEEITINYWLRRWHWKSCRTFLADNYHFDCTCFSVCGKPGNPLKLKASEAAFNNIDKIDPTLFDERRSILYPEESLLNAYRRNYTEYRSMNVKDSRLARGLVFAWGISVQQGDLPRARVFGARAVKAYKDCLGADDPMTIETIKKTANPALNPMYDKGSYWNYTRLTDFELRMSERDPDELDQDEHDKWLWRPGKIFWFERDYTKMFMEVPFSWRDTQSHEEKLRDLIAQGIRDIADHSPRFYDDDESSTDRDEAVTETSARGDEEEEEEEENGKEDDGERLPGLGIAKVYLLDNEDGLPDVYKKQDLEWVD